MFERNSNSKNKADMNNSKSSNNNNKSNVSTVNMVSKGTEIVGKLITQGDIRVAGTVDGEAKVDGKIIVASTGHIDGNVNATNADIAGRVEGEIHVDSKLTLRQSAVVDCDVYTEILVVEEGATFNGECHMHDYGTNESKESSQKTDATGSKESTATTENEKKKASA